VSQEPREGPITADEEIVLEQPLQDSLAGIFSLDDFEARARRVLSDPALAYIAGGAADEITLKNNAAAFRKRRLRPRVLAGVDTIDPSTAVLDASVSMPVGLAPTALNRLASSEGEAAAAHAAADAGILFCVSTFSSCSLEEAAEAQGPRWFQLYVLKDRGLSEEILRRAHAAGYSAVVLTADLPVIGYRERELHAGDGLDDPEAGNFAWGQPAERADPAGPAIEQSLSWSDLSWAAEVGGLPVVVKGILTGEDAALAVENGAAGIVVSNHGGRQLDKAPATVDVLEECVDAVGGRGLPRRGSAARNRRRYRARAGRPGRVHRPSIPLCDGGWRAGGRCPGS
jgi:4-hydroxymandelate oxidase